MLQTNILWAIFNDLPAGWPLAGHSHPFYHLFYIKSGNACFWLDHVPYQVSSGTCVLVPPGVFHELPAEQHSLMDSYEIKFTLNDSALETYLRAAGPIFPGSPFTETTIAYIVRNWESHDPLCAPHVGAYLDALLLSLYQEQQNIRRPVSTYIDVSPYPELVQRIIHYIEQNHTEDFSLDALGEALGYNKRYLCGVFRASVGMTIIDYLSHIRIRHATFLLYYHDVPTAVVGQYVGFVSSVHFSRVFKKLTGMSPGRYRQLYTLRSESLSEQQRLTGKYPSQYEELLGVKVLPLAESVLRLQQLGSEES